MHNEFITINNARTWILLGTINNWNVGSVITLTKYTGKMLFISIEYNSGYNSSYFKNESYITVDNINHGQATYHYGYFYSSSFYANIAFTIRGDGNNTFYLSPATTWTSIVANGKAVTNNINMKVWARDI